MDTGIVERPGKRALQLSKSNLGLRSAFIRCGDRAFSGFVVDPKNLDHRFSVEILIDGFTVRVIRADASVQELIAEQIGDGSYGFSCSLDAAAVSDGVVIEARLANLGTTVGTPVILAQQSDNQIHYSKPGNVKWLGGLRFSGWTANRQETAAVFVDGILVIRTRASTWSHVGTGDDGAQAVRIFDFHLPRQFADGVVHELSIVDDTAESTSGSAVFFIAYPDGLREAVAGHGLSEHDLLRAELVDRLLPMSVPFSEYQTWRERCPFPADSLGALRGAVIMVGGGLPDDTLATLEEQTHAGWVAASLPQTLIHAGLDVELAKAFLNNEAAECDFVVFTSAGTLFLPYALQRISGAFSKFESAQAVYSDLEIFSSDGSIWPLAFPAFDYERMLEQGYCAHLFALRRSTALQSLEAGASNLYRIFNSILDDGLASHSEIIHLPGALGTCLEFDKPAAADVLAIAGAEHLQRHGIAAQVMPRVAETIFPAVQVIRKFDSVYTTIIIPTRNRLQLLQGCIESILPAVARMQAEIVVVDNDSSEPEMLEYLADIDNKIARVLHVPGAFNFPRLNNLAVKFARGDMLCLLNNDVKALDDIWLQEMLGRISVEDVGAVGALLVWPSGIVQHGGVVLGPGFAATHAFNDRIDGDVGYGDLLCIAHECSAVTAACLVTRRRDYLDVGGMDEIRFPVNFNDVDYCLKLRASGKRVVFTPHAKLVHLESASRGLVNKANQQERFERELQNLRAKWGDVLANDPYYSPILSLDPIPFSALAWPVRTLDARANNLPIARNAPSGF